MANMRADAQKANKEKEKKDLLKIGGGTKTVSNPAKTTQNIKPTNTGKSGKTNKTGNNNKGGKSGTGKKTTMTQTGKESKPQTSAVKAAATPPEKKKTTPKTTTNTGHVKALLGGSSVNMRKDAQKANTLKTQRTTGGIYQTAAKPAQTVQKEKKSTAKPNLNLDLQKKQAQEALKSLPKMPNFYQAEKQNRTFQPGKSKTPGILTPETKAQREGRQKLITEPYTDLQLNAQQKGLKKSLQQVTDQLASGYYAPGSTEEAKANQQRKRWKEQLADVENRIEERKQAKYNQQNQSRAALMASEGKRDANYQATLQNGADTAKKLNNVMADRNRGQQIAKYIADPSYKTYLNQYRLTRASDVTAEEMRNLEYMTQEEKDTALYYAGKGDWQQIADYYDLLKRDLNARRRQTESQKRQNFANQHKVLGGLENIASGTLTPMAAVATLGQAAKNKITGQSTPADPNSDWYMGPQIQGDTAQGITRDMSTGGRIAAQTALGLGQMAATLPLGGAALPMMGLQGAGTSGYQALQNGASTGNAARNAIASGLLNYVSAKLPVERLLKTAGGQVTPNTVKGILANAGLMAGTGGATQIAETLTDMAINGRRSAYNQYVNELTASGYSTEAAKRQANLQFFVKDIAETMAVSGLTGGLLGAGAELHGRRLQTAREAALAEQLAQKIAARMEGRAEQGDVNRLLPTAAEEEAPFMAVDADNGKRTYKNGKWRWEPDDDTTPGFGEPENQAIEAETPEEVPFLDPSKPRLGELRTYEEDVAKAEENAPENRQNPAFEDVKTELERGETLQDTPSQERELPTYEQDELNRKKQKIRQQNFGESDPEILQAVKDNEAEMNFTPRHEWRFDDDYAMGIQGKRLGSLLHSAYSMDLGRVLDRVSGKDSELRGYLYNKIERPLLNAKNHFAHDTRDRLDAYYQDMKRLGIRKGSKESAAVQWFGEGERLNRKTGELEPYTLDDLKREFPKKWQDIQKADGVNRALYDGYIRRMNDVLEIIYPDVEEKANDQLKRLEAEWKYADYGSAIQNLTDAIDAMHHSDQPLSLEENKKMGRMLAELSVLESKSKDAMAEINLLRDKIKSGEIYRGKRLFPRKDYYHHFKEFESGFAGLKNLFKGDFDIDPELVGVSDHTLPNSKWAAWLQRRTGIDRTDDSVAGVLKYIQEAEYKIAIDPIIAQYRTVVRDIARGTRETRNANKFIEWMMDYTNDLAGKTNPIDRPFQKITSRKFIKGIMWLNNRVKSNAVMGNLSSAVSQVYNLPNLLGYIKNPIDIANGVRDYAKYKIANDGDAFQAIDSSGFITERYLGNYVDKFDSGILAKPEKFAAWLLEVGDKSVAEAGWFMAYDQGIRKGVEDPVMYADDIVRRSVGGRGVGEIPIAFKSNIVKLVAPFQIEANNAYQVLREKVGKKDAIGIIMILGSTFLMNEIRENYIDGRRTGMDLINATINGLDAAEDKKSPIGKVGMVAGRLGGEFLGNIPFGDKVANTLMNNKKLSEDFFGTNDFSRMGTGPIGISTIVEPGLKYLNGDNADFADPALKILLPYGGAQAARSKNALEDLGVIPKIRANQDDGFVDTKKEGAYDDDGNLKYPLDSKDPVDFLTATLMGSTATRGGKEYADEDYASLNKDQTKAYEKLVAAGLDQMTSWHKIKELAKIKGDKDEDGETIKGSQAKNQSTYLLDSGLSTSDQAKIYFAVVADEYTQNRKAYLTKNGVDESSYYRFLMNTRNTVGDQNENGDTISGSLEKNKLKELEKMKLNDQQKAAIYFTDFASNAHKEQLEKLEKRDVDASTYYRYMCDTMDITKAVSKDGKTYNYSDMIRKLKYLEDKKYDKETAAKLLYFDLNSDSYIVKAYDENADKIREKGVGGYDFLKFLTISNAVSAEKDKNGKTINGSKRKKVLAFIDSMDISKSAKDALYYAADYKQKTIGSAPWRSGTNWSKYIPTFLYLADDYQNGEKKDDNSADYGNAVSFGGGETGSVGAALKAGNGTSGGSYYGDSGGYSRKKRKSRKKRSSRRRSGRRRSGGSSGRSSLAAANQLLRASQAMNLVNGQFDSSGYVSRVKNLMTNLGIDANNEQVPELINVLGGLTAAQKHEIYSGVGGTNTVNFDDGLTTGGGDGSLLSGLSGSGNYLPRGEDADDSLLERLSKIKYAK